MNSEYVPAKYCSKCGVLKPLTEYYFHNKRTGTLRANCKDCQRVYQKKYYEDNRDKFLDNQRQYYQDHRDEILEQHKQYYQDNCDKILDNQKQYYQDHRDEIRDYQKQYRQNNWAKICNYQRQYYQDNRDEILGKQRLYYQDHRDKFLDNQKQYYQDHRDEILDYHRQYYQDNRDTIIERQKEYHNYRYRTDPAYRFATILRGRLNYVLNTLDTIDSRITLALVGCSSDWFGHWLEYCNVFYCPNSLDTHVDHVFPMASYNILDPNESRKAMDWKNLRVIDARDNLIKGKSRPTNKVIQIHQQLIYDFYDFMRRVHPSILY